MRVLVVEDEAALAEGVRRGLEAEGFATDVARNGGNHFCEPVVEFRSHYPGGLAASDAVLPCDACGVEAQEELTRLMTSSAAIASA